MVPLDPFVLPPTQDTPIIEGINALDRSFVRGEEGEFVLHHQRSDGRLAGYACARGCNASPSLAWASAAWRKAGKRASYTALFSKTGVETSSTW